MTKAVYTAEDSFQRLPFHWMWWPALGGVAIGVGGLLFPQALGVGYDTIGALLQGDVPRTVIAGILLVKSAIWVIALGSGTSGGVLAPLLMMGGALGGVEAAVLPNLGVGFWPLVSMGAILGGTMRSPFTGIVFALEDGHLVAKLEREDPQLGRFHGLARSLVANAVAGVTDGFKRELDIVGVGYRAEVKGKQVIFALGYSHAVVYDIPNGIDVVIEKQTHITVTGVDRQLVGQVAANIRHLREPDPYKQKGVRYTGEVLKKKAGKTGAK